MNLSAKPNGNKQISKESISQNLANSIYNLFLINHPEFEDIHNDNEKKILISNLTVYLKKKFDELDGELESYFTERLKESWFEIHNYITKQ